MITFEVKTVRSFTTEARFKNWFDRHIAKMRRHGFLDAEISQVSTPEGLTIVDPEDGTDGSVTVTQIKGRS